MTDEPNSQPDSLSLLPKLISVGSLFKQASQVYRSRLGTFFGIAAVPMIFTIIGIIVTVFSYGGLSTNLWVVLLGAFFYLTSAFFSILSVLAIIYAISKPISIIDAYHFALTKALSFIWIVILDALIIVGGFALFIVPGIIFLVWFSFASYILVYEDSRGINALLRSKSYARGYFWPILGRTLCLMLITLGISYIFGLLAGLGRLSFDVNAPLTYYKLISQVFAQLLSVLITPFILIYSYLLYHDVAAKKTGALTAQPAEKKWPFIGAGIFGVLIIPALLLLFAYLGLNSVKGNARDVRRYLDIKNIQFAIDMYYKEHKTYPPALNDLSFKWIYGGIVPRDPLTNLPYNYELQSGGKDFKVCAQLESTTTPACATAEPPTANQ